MKKISYKLCIAALLASLCVATANAEPFPRGCEVKGFGFSNGQLIVNDTGRQAFYIIRNRSTIPIQMQRVETHNVFMSPPLTAKLDGLSSAAFASDIMNFHFECLNTDPENIQPINCADVLDICEYPRVKFALSNMGNYWVSVNKTQQEVINDAVGKGIYLKW